MTAPYAPLARALVLSLVLHALVLLAGLRLPSPIAERPRRPALSVHLEKEIPAPRLTLPEPVPPPPAPPRHASAERPRPAPPARESYARLQGAAARAANDQISRELLYPLEAIEQGLQGEATVLLFLNGSGDVIAARLESSSGHALLDDAAVRAARTLRALPESAPREALLPVRFRLR